MLSIIAAACDASTMSSREIAELCNKEHKHVMRDIRAMLEDLELGESKFGSSYVSEQNKEIPCFNLDKELTLTLVAGYSTVLRSRIVKRWMELEGEQNNPMKMLSDPATMRTLLLSYTEKVIELKTGLSNYPPLVDRNQPPQF